VRLRAWRSHGRRADSYLYLAEASGGRSNSHEQLLRLLACCVGIEEGSPGRDGPKGRTDRIESKSKKLTQIKQDAMEADRILKKSVEGGHLKEVKEEEPAYDPGDG
jgi:hypothetical protein